jgi:hypothetical protein
MIVLYILLTVFVGIPLLFILVMIFTATWEKRMVWPYSKPMPPDVTKDEHCTEKNQQFVDNSLHQMQHYGFRLLHRCTDMKGPKYPISYLFALSEDQLTLAIVGYGYVFSIPVKGVILVSKDATGKHYYCSTTAPSDFHDLTGLSETRVWLNEDFSAIYQLQQAHLRHVSRVAFSENPLEEYRKFLQKKSDRLIEQRIAQYVGYEKRQWKYTLVGAVKQTVMNQVKTLKDAH